MVSSLMLGFGALALRPRPENGVGPAAGALGVSTLIAAREALDDIRAGEGAFRRAEYAAAEDAFTRALKALPDVVHAPTLAALLRLESADAYRRLVGGVQANLGLVRLRQRRWNDALGSLEAAIAIDGASVATLSNLGLAQMHARRYDDAWASLAAVARSPGAGAKDHLDAGRAAYYAGREDDALRASARALELARRERTVRAWGAALEAYKLGAHVLIDRGRWAEAERKLRTALALAPGDAQARYLLVLALARQGRDADARREQEVQERVTAVHAEIQARLSEPYTAPGLRAVAELYDGLGLLHQAHLHYAQLTARDPTASVARERMRSIALAVGERTTGSP